ncbi:hypothetical protein [Ktedonospora formicarum]|uniref:Uncharacterized protein n=1 Tax=Ktedonospora formicarum TaxID=2778364 RepID=A0A8J3I923_9CHLR|nr:hypothetical protein [Ktedonospora formicarum]GHO49065.1 hypothetical protein KSX_72280 [Ktedonospora formicarum]
MDQTSQNQSKGRALHAAFSAYPNKPMKSEMRLRRLIFWLVQALCSLLVVCDLFYLVNNLVAAFAFYHTACADPTRGSCAQVVQLSVTQFPALAHYGWLPEGYALYALICDLIQIVFYLGLATLIFWRTKQRRIRLFTSLWLITFACVSIEHVPLPGLLGLLGDLLQPLAWIGLMTLFAIFPDGRFVPRWAWLLPVLFVVLVCLSFAPLFTWFGVAAYGIFLITVGMQVYRYRAAASAIERQQIKWFASGFAAFVIGLILQNLLPLVIPILNEPDSWYHLANPVIWTGIFVLIPIGIGIALLRYRLWDIDVIINRSLVYGLLTLLLGLIYIGLIIGGQAVVDVWLKANEAPVIVISTLLVATLFHPLRQRIQQIIDQRFYRQKYDAARALEGFRATVQQEVELEPLCGHILQVVQETVQPEQLSLWLIEDRHQSSSSGAVPQPNTSRK